MKQKHPRRNHALIILVLIAVSSLLFAYVSLVKSRQARADTYENAYTVKNGTVVRTVSGPGTVVAGKSTVLYARSGGQVLNIYAPEGSRVKHNQLLLRLTGQIDVRAPLEGEVALLYVKENEWVSPGSRLMELIDFDSLEVMASVDELDVGRMQVGQTVDIYVNALVNRAEPRQGTITSIARQGTITGGITTFAVRISIHDAAELLIGMSAEIRVLTHRVENVLVIPVEAVDYDAEQPHVVLRSNSSTKKQEVTLGLSDGNYVEVVTGLSLGDEIVYGEKGDSQKRELIPPFMRRPRQP